MNDRDWNAKCGGMFLGLLGAVNLARLLGLDPHLMLEMLMTKLDETTTTTPRIEAGAMAGGGEQ